MNNMLFFNRREMFSKAMCMLDNYDLYTKNHCLRVGMYTSMFLTFLRENNLLPEELEKCDIKYIKDIIYAAFVHDIGKIAVTSSIVNNQDKLTKEEWIQIQNHTLVGAMFFRDDIFKNIYDGILLHHERIDGDGYPFGKSGKDIPIVARIVSIFDSFDAMTDKRSYVKREAMTLDEFGPEIQKCIGIQFDEEIVNLVLKMCKDSKYDKILDIKKDEGNFLKIVESICKWVCCDEDYEISFIRKNNEYKVVEKEKAV